MGYLIVSLGLFFSSLFAFADEAFAAIEFIINDSAVNGQEINATASISGLTTSSCFSDGRCFIRAVLRKVGSSRYFGQTQNNQSSWVDYMSSFEKEFLQNNFYSFSPSGGSWSGQIKAHFYVDDPEYFGPADYEFKLQRFSGNSTNPAGESNVLVLTLSALTPTPIPTASPTPTPTSTPTPTTTPTPISSPPATISKTPTPTRMSSPTLAISINPTTIAMTTPTVLGLATDISATPSSPPSDPSILDQSIANYPNWPFYLASGLVVGPAFLLYLRHLKPD